MKKYIHVTKEVRQELAKVFKVGDRTVRNALLFDKDRGDTDCAKRIRMFALQKGGIVMAVVPEVEVLYDYDGMISQYFPNGAKLETDKSTGNTTIKIRMPENGVLFAKTLFLTDKHRTIMSLFDLSKDQF